MQKIKCLFLTILLTVSMFAMDKYVPEETTKIDRIEQNYVKKYEPEILSGREQARTKIETKFTYSDTNVYEIYSTPDFLTTLQLNADEKVTFLAGGDTERWMLEEAKGGKNGNTFIFIKPMEEDLQTNLLITTDKRIYNINIRSTTSEYNSLVKWDYPHDYKMVRDFEANNLVTATTDSDSINMAYTISNKYLDFAPQYVFDDGQKTYFYMRKNVREMPVLFVKGEDGKYMQTNFRVDDQKRIVIDRTAQKFKMILGKKELTITKK